ncbi:endonuclease, partial [Rhizobium ruizarguesonis]
SFVYSFQVHLGVVFVASSLIILAIKRQIYGFILLLASLLLIAHGIIMLREFSEGDRSTDTPPLFRLMSIEMLNDMRR